jgi:hypothetical protein
MILHSLAFNLIHGKDGLDLTAEGVAQTVDGSRA